ncbi:GGDEF domain-containing protein [Alteromonas stellipolaris]|uniref:GGDEF domain-containing protein n=1 Tax=Alteromonas stellipolaris TaxID=233316 RepID=UPI001428B5D3|nr:GGDEF domain-containing protein [Alteromonas stellipolaris]
MKNIKNKADIGLSLCFALFLCALLFVLVKAPLHIDPVSFYENFYYWLLIFIPGFICGTTIFIFLRYVIEQNHELAELAHIDPLMGLANRRFAFELINKNISYMNRKKRTYSVVMTDLDHVKSVNDTYGHPAGDSVIVKFAQVILNVVREYDVAFRYGGEEFLLFLPDTDISQAEEIANRIRRSLKAEPLVAEGKSFVVTASFGVASGNVNAAFTDVVSVADKALYQAKQDGRDKVVSFNDNEREQSENYAHAT